MLGGSIRRLTATLSVKGEHFSQSMSSSCDGTNGVKEGRSQEAVSLTSHDPVTSADSMDRRLDHVKKFFATKSHVRHCDHGKLKSEPVFHLRKREEAVKVDLRARHSVASGGQDNAVASVRPRVRALGMAYVG